VFLNIHSDSHFLQIQFCFCYILFSATTFIRFRLVVYKLALRDKQPAAFMKRHKKMSAITFNILQTIMNINISV
jgi:hypothetical protein